MNQPTASTITCPPAVVVMTKPFDDTGAMIDEASGRPVPSVLMNDVIVDAMPAGRTLRNPGRCPPIVVTLMAIAVASAATPRGSATVMLVPDSKPVFGVLVVRVSQMRVDSTDLNLPARERSSGTNTPVTSTSSSTPTSISIVLRTSIAPLSPTLTIVALARSEPARGFEIDVSGATVPAG